MPYTYPFTNADEPTKREVFNRGSVADGYDSKLWRRDICGNMIKYSDHGNTNSNYGWEIDHKKPVALGGPTIIDNLQPLQWENNRRKGDTYPWSCR